jgi:hypothetical protein
MGRVLSKERIKSNKMRYLVLARDGHMCRICGSKEDLEVHHMLALHLDGKSTMKNLITLCKSCHVYAPEDGIESNEEYLRKRNQVIYEHLITMPESYALMLVAYVEFIKDKVNSYVEFDFITEEQKDKILFHETNQILTKVGIT